MSRYQLPRINGIRFGFGAPVIPPDSRPSTPGRILEEDQHPNYDSRKYYPARIGETVSERYSIISKLGWGANSTVWLAKDIARLVGLYCSKVL
jgi:serine/threonine-protein kinase SRPK3